MVPKSIKKVIDLLIDFSSILEPSWEGFWRVLGAKMEAKLAKKLIKWPLVGKLAEKAKMVKNHLLFKVFWSLGPPHSHKSYTQVTPSWGPFGRFWEPCWSNVGILEGFWKILDTKLEAKLTNKLIKWPLVDKFAEKAKMLKNLVFYKVFWSLGLPTSRPTWPKIPILSPRWAILGPRWSHVGGM